MSSAPEKDYTINRFSQCLPCSASVPLQLVFVFVGTDIATLKLLEPNFHNMSEPLYSSPYKFHSCQDNCVNEHLLTESCVTGPTKNSSTVTYYAWHKRRFRRVGVKPAGSSHTELSCKIQAITNKSTYKGLGMSWLRYYVPLADERLQYAMVFRNMFIPVIPCRMSDFNYHKKTNSWQKNCEFPRVKIKPNTCHKVTPHQNNDNLSIKYWRICIKQTETDR